MASRDYRAPALSVWVEGTRVLSAETHKIVSARYEHSTLIASMLEIEVANPDNLFTDDTIWSPGNEVDLHLGYGTDPKFVGRAEIVRHLPTFSSDGVPTLKIRGYDRSHRLARQEMQVSGGRTPRKTGNSGKLHKGTVGSVFREILGKHGIRAEVEPTISVEPVQFIQRKGMTDLSALRALANIYDAEFFVYYDPDRAQWRGKLMKVTSPTGQVERYAFQWGTEKATILSLSIDYAMPAALTEVQAWVWDRDRKEYISVSEEETEKGKTELFSPGTFLSPGSTGSTGPGGSAAPIDTMTKVKIAASGHAVVVLTNPFSSPAEAARFARRWMNLHRDSFITADGVLPGVETLRAGQIHDLKGIGERYSGSYYFTTVTHQFSVEDYTVRFSGHKVVK